MTITEFNEQNQPVNPSALKSIVDWWRSKNNQDASIKSYPHPNYPEQLPKTKDKVTVKDINLRGNKLTWCQYDQNMKAEIEQIALDESDSKIIVLLKSKAKLEFYY